MSGPNEPPARQDGAQGLRVLVVAADSGLASRIVRLLELSELPVVRSIVASSLDDADQILEEQEVSVVLLGSSTFESEGLPALERIHSAAPGLPVILLTGLDNPVPPIRAVRDSVQDYLIEGTFNEKQLTRSIVYSMERKRVSDSLRSLARIVETAVEATVDLSMNGDIARWNRTAELMYGYVADEINERPFSSLMAESDDGVALREELDRLLAGQAPCAIEALHQRKDGSVLEVSVLFSMIRDEAGSPVGFSAVCRDMTGHNCALREKGELERGLLHAQKLESLGILAGGIAHDFNNLLAGIMGNIGLAIQDGLPESTMVFLKRAETGTMRAAQLTRQMLAFSGKTSVGEVPTSLNELVSEMTGLLGAVISKDTTIEYDLVSELPVLDADPMELRQVVMNLIMNASEALGGQPGFISVRTRVARSTEGRLYPIGLGVERADESGPFIYFEVKDSGMGIDKGKQSRIFEPFYTTKQSGRGLGLAAVLGIIRGYHGQIRVESEPGKGSTVGVYFPIVERRARERTGSADRQASSDAGTILVVDDDAEIRQVAAAMLEALGFAAITAANGVAGVDIYRRKAAQIAAVLLDVTMPKLGGIATLRELRRLDPDIKVLLMSGYMEDDARTQAEDPGVAGFVHKPFRVRELSEELNKLMS